MKELTLHDKILDYLQKVNIKGDIILQTDIIKEFMNQGYAQGRIYGVIYDIEREGLIECKRDSNITRRCMRVKLLKYRFKVSFYSDNCPIKENCNKPCIKENCIFIKKEAEK